MKDYITLAIVSDGELFSIQHEVPEVFAVSSGAMSLHSALLGTVSMMLKHLCRDLREAEKGYSSETTGRQCGTCIESQSSELPVSCVCKRCNGHGLWMAEPEPHTQQGGNTK
jgi:hypothetical protein